MTTILFLKCVLAGVLGIAFHIAAIKLPALKQRSEAANKPFSALDYFKDDWVTILGSVLTVAIFLLILDEVVHFNPIIMDYVKFFFAFVGFVGSSILQKAFSKTEKKILQVIDVKTNIADNK